MNYLEAMRRPDGVECLSCHGKRVTRLQTNETTRTRKKSQDGELLTKRVPARFCQCMDQTCAHQFSVTTGAIFHDTHLSLDKWFFEVALMTNSKKGLSYR